VPCGGSPHPLGLSYDRRADHRRSRGPYSLPAAFRICDFCTVLVRELSNPRRPRRGCSRAIFYLQGSTFSKLRPHQGMCPHYPHYSLSARTALPSIQSLTVSHFISSPNLVRLTSFLTSRFLIMLMYLGKLSSDVLEVLICTLARFFSFAVDFHPESQSINKTTYTSSYTYWFLALSAEILTKCSLSTEMQARHAYLVAVIPTRPGEGEACKYFFLTASSPTARHGTRI
jgi:hypothetical protein